LSLRPSPMFEILSMIGTVAFLVRRRSFGHASGGAHHLGFLSYPRSCETSGRLEGALELP
jgi:hypothetical protein